MTTFDKPVQRVTRGAFNVLYTGASEARQIVVRLAPGDVLEFRELGRRQRLVAAGGCGIPPGGAQPGAGRCQGEAREAKGGEVSGFAEVTMSGACRAELAWAGAARGAENEPARARFATESRGPGLSPVLASLSASGGTPAGPVPLATRRYSPPSPSAAQARSGYTERKSASAESVHFSPLQSTYTQISGEVD